MLPHKSDVIFICEPALTFTVMFKKEVWLQWCNIFACVSE